MTERVNLNPYVFYGKFFLPIIEIAKLSLFIDKINITFIIEKTSYVLHHHDF